MPDLLFSLPRLAELYDPLDPDRDDLDAYVVLLNELGARSVLDREAFVAGVGELESWVEVPDVQPTTVSFRSTFHFRRDREVVTSSSTLRFRDRDEIAASLRTARFEEPEIRDAPDRPGLELVVVAQRRD